MLKVRSKAPLRLGLGGGGTDIDVYSNRFGGLVLNATISLFVHCTIIERDDKKIYFESTDSKQSTLLPLSNTLPLDGDMLLYKGIYNRLMNIAPPPLEASHFIHTLMCLVAAGLVVALHLLWLLSRHLVNGSTSHLANMI